LSSSAISLRSGIVSLSLGVLWQKLGQRVALEFLPDRRGKATIGEDLRMM
jgi:hypothetical protein